MEADVGVAHKHHTRPRESGPIHSAPMLQTIVAKDQDPIGFFFTEHFEDRRIEALMKRAINDGRTRLEDGRCVALEQRDIPAYGLAKSGIEVRARSRVAQKEDLELYASLLGKCTKQGRLVLNGVGLEDNHLGTSSRISHPRTRFFCRKWKGTYSIPLLRAKTYTILAERATKLPCVCDLGCFSLSFFAKSLDSIAC